MRKLLFLAVTAIALMAGECKPQDAPEPKPVTGISVTSTPSPLSLTVGDATGKVTAKITPANATNKNVTWSSANTGIATVNASGIVTAVAAGNATITATAKDGSGIKGTCTATVAPDPDVTDAGVTISGTTWATRNAGEPGKFAATPEDAGMFYPWNRKKGWPAIGPVTDWDATTPAGPVWEAANDPCPDGWQVPTGAQFDALISTSSVWDNTKKGRTFGAAPNTIFLPTVGYRSDVGSLQPPSGYYWAGTTPLPSIAHILFFSDLTITLVSGMYICGLPVRCVKK